MYKHIIWDFDGTLFDTYPVMAKIFQELLQERGREEPVENIVKQLKVSMSAALNYYEKKYQIDEEFKASYQARRREVEADSSKPFAGITEVCKYIHSTDRKNYLYTHRGESSIRLLEKFGLDGYFSDFITSQNGFERKPSPAAIRHLIKKHGIVPTEAIMIGDRDLDLIAAKNAGISACYYTELEDTNPHAEYIIKDFQQLYTIV
ncbi:HAD-IA family hydrolase [Sediminibacillus dalangtanensis]|uniref:HAD-IA family hydrolase n=1 Tax=Sediminibacillus dalangtanensis TaxID=2729421 RepID=A0ABX7VN23_9BACI|nr:HAD-IA family hydrolase [Sediminibacillus dalangtanensis]QTM98219.1 HAD-IA family hydrolase [Sediminibacillus dalangtanensis]